MVFYGYLNPPSGYYKMHVPNKYSKNMQKYE